MQNLGRIHSKRSRRTDRQTYPRRLYPDVKKRDGKGKDVCLYETHGLKNQQHTVGSTSGITFISIWLLSNSHLHVTPCCVIGGASVLPLSISTKQSMDGTVGTNASQRGAQTQVGTSVWALITGCTHEAPERIPFFFQADRPQSRHIWSPHDQMLRLHQALLSLHTSFANLQRLVHVRSFVYMIHNAASHLLPCLLSSVIKSILLLPDLNHISETC